jgi:hypothetical protein
VVSFQPARVFSQKIAAATDCGPSPVALRKRLSATFVRLDGARPELRVRAIEHYVIDANDQRDALRRRSVEDGPLRATALSEPPVRPDLAFVRTPFLQRAAPETQAAFG